MILSACAPAAPVELTDEPIIPFTGGATPSLTSSPLAPTASVAPTASSTQPVEPSPTPEPIPVPVRLAVITSQAKLTRGDASAEIRQAQAADVLVDDQVEIIELEGQNQRSYSLLQIAGLANVEILGNAAWSLEESRQGVEAPSEVTLNLTDGQMFVYLSEQELLNLTVQTTTARIKALTSGAEFDVCRTEELTCVMVKRGIVEVIVKGRREVVKAGSAAVIPDADPAVTLICAPVPAFLAWEERYRLSTDTSSLQQEIAALPQQSCLTGANGYPWNARIFYRDEFSRVSRWDRGQFDQFAADYVRTDEGRFYQVQIQGAGGQYLPMVPSGRDFQDVNIDVQVRARTANDGDLRYGIVLRRSGEQYYAFIVSPVTETWWFLKHSSTGVEELKSGESGRIRGLEGQDTLRVESFGSTFLLFINERFIDLVSDPSYAKGQVGLFVESIDNPEAIINFNSITIWDLPPAERNRVPGENCFNGIDDDTDGLTDLSDPTCQRPETALPFPTIPPLPTVTPKATRTPRPTRTPRATSTPRPTNTLAPTATEPTETPKPTQTRRPTRTPTEPPPAPTDTRRPTRTPTDEPPTSVPPTPTPRPPTPTDEPPTSEPPTSEPPTSEPPTSEPPTSEPPTSEPPTSEPEPTQPTEPPTSGYGR